MICIFPTGWCERTLRALYVLVWEIVYQVNGDGHI